MTAIDTTSSAQSMFANLGLATPNSDEAKIGNDLGQQDFLTLMTTQLKNQDPFKPMENGEFLAQMAQFSTVSGIESVNETLGTISEGLRSFRIATASNLLGEQVLVPGDVARPDEHGLVHGAVELPEAADQVTVAYSDAETGEVLHTESYGRQDAGMMGFEWNTGANAERGDQVGIRVAVMATNNGATTNVGPSVFAKVLSVHAEATGADVTYNVEDYGDVSSTKIDTFR